MKSYEFQQNPLWENNLKNNQLNNYKAWLARKNFTDETISRYLITINQFSGRELNTDSVISFLRDGLTKYQPNTLRGQKNALASYAKFLKLHNEIEWDIISKIIPRIQKRPFPILTQEEFERLLLTNTQTDQWTNERNNLIIEFFWHLGIRLNELINIRHSDYYQRLLRVHGKGNKIRHIPFPEFLAKHFNLCSHGYLFTTKSGKKLTKSQVRRNLQRKAKIAGINKHISPHSFRRSFATNLYNLGGKLETIQKQLGHTSLNTTMDYIHNDFEVLYSDCNKLWQNKTCEI